MSDKYLYFTLHIAFAYLGTFWSAYNQEKRHPTKNYFGNACDDLVKHLIYFLIQASKMLALRRPFKF